MAYLTSSKLPAAVTTPHPALRPVVTDPEERTLPRLLERQVAARPDAPFLRSFGGQFAGFGQIDSETNRVANALAGLGLGAGDRLMLMLPNGLDFVRVWFAAAKLGAIEVPVNPELRGRLLAHVLANSRPRVVACAPEYLDALAEPLRDQQVEAVVVVGGDGGVPDLGPQAIDFAELLAEGNDDPPTAAARVRHSDPLAILYTSGTTGPAKGVLMPHHQFYVFTETFCHGMGLTSDDSYYTPLPLFHADAQLFGVYFPLIYGTRGTLDTRFSASRYWDNVRASEASATNMLGAMAHVLWKREAQADDQDNPVRVCQALPMIPFKSEFESRFGMRLVTAYGQTESNFVTFDTPDNSRDGSCGLPSPAFDVAIVDELDQPQPAGAIGEIVVRPKEPWWMSSGYFGMDDETVAATRNLWWHSGDLGRMDEDGWLYFEGRVKDVIRRWGENISPHEIETVINELPNVIECAAFGVPSELSEEEVKVVVVLRELSATTPEDLLAYCEDHLTRTMVPRYVALRDTRLPRTPTQKIAKEVLRAEQGAHHWDREQAGYELRARPAVRTSS